MLINPPEIIGIRTFYGQCICVNESICVSESSFKYILKAFSASNVSSLGSVEICKYTQTIKCNDYYGLVVKPGVCGYMYMKYSSSWYWLVNQAVSYG